MSETDAISEDFLKILRCPKCGDELDVRPRALACRTIEGCGLSFPVVDGIPHLVIEEGLRRDDSGGSAS